MDTNVDLAAEFGVDEARLRRAVDRNWLGRKAAGEMDELEKLLQPEPVEPVSIAQALAELPRLLSDAGRAPAHERRRSASSPATSPTEPRCTRGPLTLTLSRKRERETGSDPSPRAAAVSGEG